MSLFTSSQFASCAETGTDWRDTSKKVLEQLESVRTEGADFNFGFLYLSDLLASDATSILNLFRSVLNIENWVGCVGVGVCGTGSDHIDEPAISAMIGHFDADSFCLFPPRGEGAGEGDPEKTSGLETWLNKNDPMIMLVHGDPLAEQDPALTLQKVSTLTNAFLIGGLSSSRTEHFQVAGELKRGALSGCIFSQNIAAATALSQGCAPIGPLHTITKGDDHIIAGLDNLNAVEVFEGDLRSMTIKKIDKDPDEIILDNPDEIPEEFQSLIQGEIHIAFPVSGSDQEDYLVRNIIGMDPDEGSLTVAQNVLNGENVLFVKRDDDTVKSDLSHTLVKLRERVLRETGSFQPKGAIYISCAARAFSNFGGNKNNPAAKGGGEMALVRDIIGDVPLAGFYAGGEISNARLYGYTGVLTLFL